MIEAGKLRPGMTFILDSQPHVVIDASHNKTARSAAVAKIKMKNMITGATNEQTYRTSETFKPAIIDKKDMQYLYDEGDALVFMDNVSFDQISIPKKNLEWEINFLKEQEVVKVRSFDEKVLDIELSAHVTLQVQSTEPAVKGNTATNATKKAVLETGFEIQVPMFIEEGEMLEISTQTGKYSSRAK